MDSFDEWIAGQYRHSAVSMLRSVSAVAVVKLRPGFDQRMHPAKGSILASPIPASYDPEPDYFFHWYRDSAIVVDALRVLAEDPGCTVDARTPFAEFVHFSRHLTALDGRALAAATQWRTRTTPRFTQYLRASRELEDVHGDGVAADTRVNPDGTLDITDWPRPQHDGPALRALVLLRWLRSPAFDALLAQPVAALVRDDLRFTCNRWQQSCFDIWEEEKGFHYYAMRIAAAALADGAIWHAAQGETLESQRCHANAAAILHKLDAYWSADLGYFRSRVLDSGAASAKDLDVSVILAAVHAGSTDATHSTRDPRMFDTLHKLSALFDREYEINKNRPTDRAPALGRYAGDVYFSGGAYYFSTLGAAEFHYRAALRALGSQRWIERGDEYLRTVRAFTPPSGNLSEQFDQHTGAPNSAQHLAWSYAAFISCIGARRSAMKS